MFIASTMLKLLRGRAILWANILVVLDLWLCICSAFAATTTITFSLLPVIIFHEVVILLYRKLWLSTRMMLCPDTYLRLRTMSQLLKVRLPIFVFHGGVRLCLIMHEHIRLLLMLMYWLWLSFILILRCVHVALLILEVRWILTKSSVHHWMTSVAFLHDRIRCPLIITMHMHLLLLLLKLLH